MLIPYLLMIIIWIICLIFCFYYRKLLLYPPILTLFIWSITIIISMVVFYKMYDWSYAGLMYIFFALIIFLVFNIFGSNINGINKVNPDSFKKEKKNFNTKIPYLFLNLCTLVGTLYPVNTIIKNGFNLSVFFNMDYLLSLNRMLALGRYTSAETYYSPLSQVLLVFIYAAPIIGGYTYVYSEKDRKGQFYTILTMIPSILNLVISNGKAGIIINVMLWLSGFFVARLEKYGKLPNLNLNLVKNITLVIISLIALLYTSFFFRYGGYAIDTLNRINERMLVYALGHIPSFDNIFSFGEVYNQNTYGYRTFEGLFRMISSSKRVSMPYPWLELEIGGTNVGTIFSGLLSDYGIIGSYVAIGIFGVLSGASYERIVNTSKIRIMSKVFLTVTYSIILYSFLTSIIIYVSVIASFIIYLFFLILIQRYEFDESRD